MFEKLTNEELETLIEKMNRAVSRCWNLTNWSNKEGMRYSETGIEIRGIRAEMLDTKYAWALKD